MCRWMGFHFHDWIASDAVAFSIELLEWGRTFSGFWRLETSGTKKFLKWEDKLYEELSPSGSHSIESEEDGVSNGPPKDYYAVGF